MSSRRGMTLWTKMSQPPSFCAASWTRSSARLALDVSPCTRPVRAYVAELGQGFRSVILTAEVMDRDLLDTLGGQLHGYSATDTTRTTGDEGRLKRDPHGCHPPRVVGSGAVESVPEVTVAAAGRCTQ